MHGSRVCVPKSLPTYVAVLWGAHLRTPIAPASKARLIPWLVHACVWQASAVEELSHVHNMPLAYDAALAEVTRRRTFGRQYVAKVRGVSQALQWRGWGFQVVAPSTWARGSPCTPHQCRPPLPAPFRMCRWRRWQSHWRECGARRCGTGSASCEGTEATCPR
jgi:hypothetical protein